ncbi:MAG: EutN/CcmL family microcompartment protein [Planctomycetota bacterium]
MHLARVIGTVVATRKVAGLDGIRFLIVQPLDHNLKPKSEPVVATDAVQAGEGELVHIVLGREASMALPEMFVPVDVSVVGHVDEVDCPVPSKRKKR